MPPDTWINRQKFLVAAVALTFVLTANVGIGLWYVRSKSSEPNVPVLDAPYNLESISTNGKVSAAAISPDGKWVVYTNRGEGRESVWLRQLDTAENVEIIPPGDVLYRQFEFSPDGNSIYFSRQIRLANEPAAIYRIPVRGGIPTKIIDEMWFHFSLSPDGQRISFHRCCQSNDEYYSLLVADSADGNNERKILSTKHPFRIADNRISPDGNRIAFAVGQSENEGNDFSLKTVDLESGVEREITEEKFFNIKYIRWLPDQSGLIFTAAKIPNKYFRIWRVSVATGEVQPLTKDSENYNVLSLDKSGSRLISTQTKEDFRLQLRNLETPSVNKVLSNAAFASFAPDSNVIFSSLMTGNDEIWSINTDGSGQRQLTNNTADDRYPIASPSDGSIFFTSNRTGEAHVWRMNADGSNQMQITRKEGGFPLLVSPDGNRLYYHHGINRTLWRVPTSGGNEELVLNKAKDKDNFDISFDGTQVAFSENKSGQSFLQIVSLADGQIIKNHLAADQKGLITAITWLPDGKNLAYIQADIGYQNYTLWLQPPDGKARKITGLGDEEIFSLKFAPNGKNFIITQGGWRHDAVLLKGLE
jgi:Tol biopolymer transport system component